MEEAVIITPSVSLGDHFMIDLKITSHFPQTVKCNKVCISVIKSKSETPPDSSLFEQKKICHVRTPSLTNGKYEHLANFQPVKKTLPAELEFAATYEMKDEKVTAAGVSCVNSYELLKRLDSVPSVEDCQESSERADYSMGLSTTNVTLVPGENVIHLKMKVSSNAILKHNTF